MTRQLARTVTAQKPPRSSFNGWSSKPGRSMLPTPVRLIQAGENTLDLLHVVRSKPPAVTFLVNPFQPRDVESSCHARM